MSSPRLTGDYQVLQGSVVDAREKVQISRAILATFLDRLGEHHVRQKEYDEAMDAFTEALHEKRSIYASTLGVGSRSISFSGGSTFFGVEDDNKSERHDQAIDDIIHTLRNMGNVHSLRGEQDEAMRYYSEVTNLNATKTSTKVDIESDSTTLFSGIGGEEDNSTLMSEINEDVKALDDMFRSISFRARDGSAQGRGFRLFPTKPLTPSPENSTASLTKKRRKNASNGKGKESMVGDGEPFRPSSTASFPVTGHELSEALEFYRSVLENYDGPSIDSHKEDYNSMALRVDLLASENLHRPDSPTNNATTTFVADLELAVEIYQHALSVQNEMIEFRSADAKLDISAGVASTWIKMGGLYYKLGNRVEELRMYSEAKSVYAKSFGENHSFVAGARKNIGMVLAERGEYEVAMEEFQKAMHIYLTVNNGDEMSRDVASAISCMGNVKNRIGELDEALSHYMDALRIYKAIHEQTSNKESASAEVRDVTSTLKVIGMVHAKKGELENAMNYFTEAMNLLKVTGVDATTTGRETMSSVLSRMAGIYVKKGDLDQAMEYYRQAYEMAIQAKGTMNHQDIAGILHYIGGIFHKRADYDEAMNCYQEAIRIYHSTLGPGNSTVAGTLVMVGSIHYKRKNLDSAMMFYREALRLNRDAYGLHHPDVAPILKSIGTILTKKGEYSEAYDVFRDVLSIKCTIYGTVHPEVASAYKSLGNVHYKLGELADAERQYRHALNIYRKTLGNDHPDTIATRTTIDHIRYWMKERGRTKTEDRQSCNTSRNQAEVDERSC